MVSVKRKNLLGAENVFLEVTGDQGEWDGGRRREAVMTERETERRWGNLMCEPSKTDIWLYSPAWAKRRTSLCLLASSPNKTIARKTTGLTKLCSPDSLLHAFLHLVLLFPPSPRLLTSLPHPTPQHVGRLMLCAQCSAGMSIKAVAGRTISATLHLLRPGL